MSNCPQEIAHSGDSSWCQTEGEPASKCAQGKAQERVVELLKQSGNIVWKGDRAPFPWEVREILVLLGMARSALSAYRSASFSREERLRGALEEIAAGSPTRPWPHQKGCDCAWCHVRAKARAALSPGKEDA